MIEALVFGFFAYFGTEIGEYAHKKYDEVKQCIETKCYNEDNIPPEGEIIILTKEDKKVSTTVIGEDNG